MTDYSSIFVQSHCVSKTQLLAYVREKLDKEEAYLVESHLNDCQFCNDALDALLEADLQVAEKDLTESKQILQQKLFPVAEPEKTIPAHLFVAQKNNRNLFKRLLVAASVMLMIGLAGYSVFSYIQSHKKELALAEKGKSSSTYDAEYKKPDQAEGEIVTLRVEENDTLRKYAEVDHTKSKTQIVPPLSTTHQTQEENNYSKTESVSPDITAKSESKPVEKAPVMETEKVAAAPVATAKENDNIVPSPGMENFARASRDEKVQSEPIKQIAKKKSVGGLKYDNSMQSNPVNYQRNNNDFNQQRNVDVQTNAQKQVYEEEIKDKEETAYEKGLNFFNNKKYRKSISWFEKALQSATAAEKEDIMYYLAQAYELSGRDEKAYEMYAALSKSKKYKASVEKKMREVQAEKAPAKK